MLGSIIYSTYTSETHGQRERSAYRHVQTHIQYTECRIHCVATRIVRRAADAAHAATAAPAAKRRSRANMTFCGVRHGAKEHKMMPDADASLVEPRCTPRATRS